MRENPYSTPPLDALERRAGGTGAVERRGRALMPKVSNRLCLDPRDHVDEWTVVVGVSQPKTGSVTII